MIVIDICLTDVPKELITEGKNGKKYLKLVLNERKSEGKFGETHTLQLSQTKEARLAGVKPTYVGSGKAYTFEQKPKENLLKTDKGGIMQNFKNDMIDEMEREQNDLPF
jgi:hypothetical protein